MRRPTQADHLAAAVDSWQAIRRLHDRGATLIDKLPDTEAARQLDDLLCIIGAHVAVRARLWPTRWPGVEGAI